MKKTRRSTYRNTAPTNTRNAAKADTPAAVRQGLNEIEAMTECLAGIVAAATDDDGKVSRKRAGDIRKVFNEIGRMVAQVEGICNGVLRDLAELTAELEKSRRDIESRIA